MDMTESPHSELHPLWFLIQDLAKVNLASILSGMAEALLGEEEGVFFDDEHLASRSLCSG